MAATLKRQSVCANLNCGFMPRRLQRDRAAVVNGAVQRQQGTVADYHTVRVVHNSSLVEHKITRSKRGGMNSIKRDRFTVAECDHCIAVGVIGRICLKGTSVC